MAICQEIRISYYRMRRLITDFSILLPARPACRQLRAHDAPLQRREISIVAPSSAICHISQHRSHDERSRDQSITFKCHGAVRADAHRSHFVVSGDASQRPRTHAACNQTSIAACFSKVKSHHIAFCRMIASSISCGGSRFQMKRSHASGSSSSVLEKHLTPMHRRPFRAEEASS